MRARFANAGYRQRFRLFLPNFFGRFGAIVTLVALGQPDDSGLFEDGLDHGRSGAPPSIDLARIRGASGGSLTRRFLQAL
jgi:hypothetical protein